MANTIADDPVAVELQAAKNPSNPPLPATNEVIAILRRRLNVLTDERAAIAEAIEVLEDRARSARS